MNETTEVNHTLHEGGQNMKRATKFRLTRRLRAAGQLYLDRADRSAHPHGEFDRAQRFYPSASEIQPCCSPIRTPTRRWPNSLNTHCRTMKHIAQLKGYPIEKLRTAVKRLHLMRLNCLSTEEIIFLDKMKGLLLSGNQILDGFNLSQLETVISDLCDEGLLDDEILN